MPCTWGWLLHRCFSSLWPILAATHQALFAKSCFAPANTSERLSWHYWSSVYDLVLFIWPCDSLPPALVIWSLDSLLLLLSAACLDLSLVKRLWVWTCLYHPCRCYMTFACLTLSFNKSCKWIPMPQTLRYTMAEKRNIMFGSWKTYICNKKQTLWVSWYLGGVFELC